MGVSRVRWEERQKAGDPASGLPCSRSAGWAEAGGGKEEGEMRNEERQSRVPSHSPPPPKPFLSVSTLEPVSGSRVLSPLAS